ncbi:unnamed protein product, partial [Amoebophrya sp. A120]
QDDGVKASTTPSIASPWMFHDSLPKLGKSMVGALKEEAFARPTQSAAGKSGTLQEDLHESKKLMKDLHDEYKKAGRNEHTIPPYGSEPDEEKEDCGPTPIDKGDCEDLKPLKIWEHKYVPPGIAIADRASLFAISDLASLSGNGVIYARNFRQQRFKTWKKFVDWAGGDETAVRNFDKDINKKSAVAFAKKFVPKPFYCG